MVDNFFEWEKVYKEEKRLIIFFEYFCGWWYIGGYIVIDFNRFSVIVLCKIIFMRVLC